MREKCKMGSSMAGRFKSCTRGMSNKYNSVSTRPYQLHRRQPLDPFSSADPPPPNTVGPHFSAMTHACTKFLTRIRNNTYVFVAEFARKFVYVILRCAIRLHFGESKICRICAAREKTEKLKWSRSLPNFRRNARCKVKGKRNTRR
jgi:hypothetical protein